MSSEPKALAEGNALQGTFAGMQTDRRLYPIVKRFIDLALASVALIALLPVFVVLALLVAIDSGLPVLYRQERVGRGGRRFTMLKFRSMHADADIEVHVEYVRRLHRGEPPAAPGIYKLARDSRVTPVGRLLRRTSLDELPQLVNVVRGDMSLVGPRPDVPYSVEAYAPWALRRLEVQPGMTGLWQVSGRAKLSIEDMLRLDVVYVDRCSLRLDLALLVRTIPAVISRSGAA
jgi:lipopolysaccharide/colanic/teichoic acid biosynthesis glycosyltransferase